MAIIKRLDRFVTTAPPHSAGPELRGWLREEFERIALAVNAGLELIDELRSQPSMFLYEEADNLVLTDVDTKIVNFTQSAAFGIGDDPDKAAGEITIPRDGFYSLLIFIYGSHDNQASGETLLLSADVNGTKFPLSAFDIASNKVDDTSFSAALSRPFLAGDIVSLYMSSTEDMIFNILSITFELIEI